MSEESIVSNTPLIRRIVHYVTKDNKNFTSFEVASQWGVWLDKIDEANKMLLAGESLGAILKFLDREIENPIVNKINKDTEFVINHWQCSNNPGYKIRFINSNLSFYVSGDVGRWDGYYGNYVKLGDLLRYAEHKNTRFNNGKN